MPASLFWSPCAPMIPMRISLEQLPPSIGRSWISTTCAPCRAAEMAAQIPESPPPTTTKSAEALFSRTTFEFASVRMGFVTRSAAARSLVAAPADAANAHSPAAAQRTFIRFFIVVDLSPFPI